MSTKIYLIIQSELRFFSAVVQADDPMIQALPKKAVML